MIGLIVRQLGVIHRKPGDACNDAVLPVELEVFVMKIHIHVADMLVHLIEFRGLANKSSMPNITD